MKNFILVLLIGLSVTPSAFAYEQINNCENGQISLKAKNVISEAIDLNFKPRFHPAFDAQGMNLDIQNKMGIRLEWWLHPTINPALFDCGTSKICARKVVYSWINSFCR